MASMRTLRRTRKVWDQVLKALYPFKADSYALFAAPGRIQHRGRGSLKELSFYERVLKQLPKADVKRFAYLNKTDPEPSDIEFGAWRNRLLGTARRTLLHEQIQRIKDLPRLPGPGRRRIEGDHERRDMRREVARLQREQNQSKTQAVRQVARDKGCSERQAWRIIKTKSRPTNSIRALATTDNKGYTDAGGVAAGTGKGTL